MLRMVTASLALALVMPLMGCGQTQDEKNSPVATKAPGEEAFDRGLAADNAGRFEEAASWYRKAAEQGAATALFNLGVLYSTGKGGATGRCQSRLLV